MTRRCELTGIGPMSGNNVSHAKNRTKRRFLPNLRRVRMVGEVTGLPIHLRISARALRSIEHCGGIEAYMLKSSDKILSMKARHYKKRVRAHAESQKAEASS